MQLQDSDELPVFDLFCGGGGFSEGARQAGCSVVFACDNDPVAISVHEQNHPACVHWCSDLPRSDIPFPRDGRPFHVHGSPPCQAFSSAGRKGDGMDANRENASLALVDWYVSTALSSGATSWTMEQVNHKSIRALLERHARRHPGRVAFTTIDFYDMGVPQRRVRIIAGTPEIIKRLNLYAGSCRRRSIEQVLPRVLGTHIKSRLCHLSRRRRHASDPQGDTVSKNVYVMAPVTASWHTIRGPSPTVLAGHHSGWWVNVVDGVPKLTALRPVDTAWLQTFPPDYELPKEHRFFWRVVGNAVPPLVAKVIMRICTAHCVPKLVVLADPASPSFSRLRHAPHNTGAGVPGVNT